MDRLNKLFDEAKRRYVYDPKDNSLGFNDRKPTDYKLNKFLKLPKSLNFDEEFTCELRKRGYIDAFGQYEDIQKKRLEKKRMKKKIGNASKYAKNKKKKTPSTKIPINLSEKERAGLDSLKKKIRSGNIIITSTDKSSRFALLRKEQYLRSGKVHTDKDERISWDRVKYIQNQVNAHMWWMSNIVGYCKNSDPKRMNNNIQGSTMEIPEMILLLKDHKGWKFESGLPIPSRPVVSGSRGVNTHISEWISEFLEPICTNMKAGEVTSTEEVLARFDALNKEIESGEMSKEKDVLQSLGSSGVGTLHKNACGSSMGKERGMRSDTFSNENDHMVEKDNISDFSLLNVLDQLILEREVKVEPGGGDDQNVVGAKGKAAPDSGTCVTTMQTTEGDCPSLNESGSQEKKNEHAFIKSALKANELERIVGECKRGGLQTCIDDFFKKLVGPGPEKSKKEVLEESNKLLRGKISQNKRQFNPQIKDMFLAGKVWRELDEIRNTVGAEREPIDTTIQDFNAKPLMLGADVTALYPSMDQCATAELAAQAVRECGINFKGIDFKLLAIYLYLTIGEREMIKLNMTEVIPTRVNVQESPLTGSLLAKTNRSKSNWFVDERMLTDSMKVEMIAQMLKLATLVMMNSTCYSFGGHIYLQRDGAGIGLRGSAVLAKITMGFWDKRWAKMMSEWKFMAKLYIRYIDDIRVYTHPIKKGWWWSEDGWIFNPYKEDLRDDLTRTGEELQKSFNSVMDFLKFTTESEADFENHFLPTLDVETQVQDDGKIVYRFYSKPTNNNLVIQKGTALANDIIFSSLRQEVIRRLSHTSKYVSDDHRMKTLNDMVQLMRNSGHQFSFIKAVMLQGTTKFEFMKYRDSLSPDHIQYMPLHRLRDHNSSERILLKYVNIMLWFKEEKLCDPFKQLWRKNIKRRMTNRGIHKKHNGPETTSVIFVPQSRNALLYKLVLEKEQVLQNQLGWGVKVLEAPGTPLLNSFITKFPIVEGCPRGTMCILCDNQGTKCGVKGVVYAANCIQCKVFGGTEKSTGMEVPTYVGETSRPWRERVIEHVRGMINIKQDSVFVQHWMEAHGTSTVCPEFKFKILASYDDPLRRQLNEALNIGWIGTMNRKDEMNSNEICQLQPSINTWAYENEWKKSTESRKLLKEKLNNFCGVMTGIKKSLGRGKSKRACKIDYLTLFTNYRSEGTDTLTSPTRKKPRRMETSTPKTTRNQHRGEANKGLIESPVEPSPIGHKSSDKSSFDNEGDGLITVGSPTQVSGDMKLLIMTPPMVESESQEERQVAYQSHMLTWAAVTRGIIKKTNSLPNLVSSTSMNALFRPYSTRVNETSRARLRANSVGGAPSVSVDSIDFTQWSNNDFKHEKIVDYGKAVNELGERVNNLEISDVGECKSTEPSTASDTKKPASTGKMVTNEKKDEVKRIIKPGGLALGLEASEDILQQPATPACSGTKRNICRSAERKSWKQRKLSFHGRELSPAPWGGATEDNEDHLPTPRRSTWSSPSTGVRRRCKARRILKVHGQPLIKEMLGFNVSDKVPEVLDDEKQDVKSNDHQSSSLEKSRK